MTKKQILKQLKHDVYCRLKPSKHGIGVFAIRDIPINTDPFKGCMPNSDFVAIPKKIIHKLKNPVKEMVKDFCPLQDGEYWFPTTGLQAIDKSYYLNHSKKPNMKTQDSGENFITSRNIKAGEELLVDYETYDDVGL
jgi:hypothetical protein